MSGGRIRQRVLVGLFVAAVAWSGGVVESEGALTTNRWRQAGGGKWENAGNWTVGTPSLSDAIDLLSTGLVNTITVDATTVLSNGVNGCMTISNLVVTVLPFATNTLLLSNAGTNVPLRILNAFTLSNGGALVVTNSALRVDGLTGGSFMNEGTVTNLADGLIVATNVSTTIGNTSPGNFTMLGGTFLASNVTVGLASQATLTMAGGTNQLTGSLTVGVLAGATGAVWVTGGQLLVTNGATELGFNGAAQITVSNGTWRARDVYLGNGSGSQGTLTIAGGTTTVSSIFDIGEDFATGAVWVTGGQLTVTNNRTVISHGRGGSMTVSNGTWLSTDVIISAFAGSQGTLTIAGGTNTLLSNLNIADDLRATGAVWVTGGQLMVTNSNTFIGNFGVGQMTVSNGTWLSRNVLVANLSGSQGTLTVVGGTNSVYSSLLIGDSFCTATGTVIVAGGDLYVTNAAGNAVLEVRTGSLILNSGTLTIDKLVITNACGHFVHTGGTLVLNTNAVLVATRDDDGDGISNGYEQSHGLDPLNSADASLDTDGDGLSNLQEFLAGTDATNSASAFRITSIAREGDNLRVTWMTGTGKTNALQRAPGGSYITNNFSAIFTVTNTVGTVTNYLDNGAATNFPAKYYRIRLVP